jgi:hypothetical protein
MRIQILLLSLVAVLSFNPGRAEAQSRNSRASYTPSDVDTRWADRTGPWDFTGLLGLYNPGFGISARGAYRILDDVIRDVNDTLSIESGLGLVIVSDNVGGSSYSSTVFEFPVMGRWDFHLPDSKFTVGPQLGFTYLSGGSVTINGVNYSVRGGSVYVEIGGFARYDLNENWGLRFDLAVGGYTVIHFGATYFL